MSNKTVLGAVALGVAIAFAGPAFADKMKAALDDAIGTFTPALAPAAAGPWKWAAVAGPERPE